MPRLLAFRCPAEDRLNPQLIDRVNEQSDIVGPQLSQRGLVV
jgi:hypothetical protein